MRAPHDPPSAAAPSPDPSDNAPFALAREIRERGPRKRARRARPVARTAHLTGRAMEDRALAWLQAHGLKLVARNVRGRRGEIDLVMRDGATVVLVEVRSRRGPPGVAAGSLTPAKLASIVRTARHWLPIWRARHWPGQDPPVRLDAVLVQEGQAEWLRDVRLPAELD
ncbi:YraN family protein [Bordetella genomosp. 5]|uniref:UPF0102 protein CAL25_03100 n=1 Tax=Bordetella genomosp. 5 TaxID=1395608 RepID=A0A261U3G8_9BORD|nr:YraN family protein [Bordetella genomosp. 5]OZI55403.1 hypothetical protein CAL25_03100 [Bordetella genomosp. 5]